MEFILITKDVEIAKYAQDSGVHRIMVDLEIIGKKERQGHLNTVISEHTLTDVLNIRQVLNESKLLVRINPIHKNSKEEIEEVIRLGADVLMLPMFTTPNEVREFVNYNNGRAITTLLLETPQALVRIDEILTIDGIDEIHIGLNDLHLAMGLNFMFELLSGGVVEHLSKKVNAAGINFGFGGISRLGQGKLDSSLILSEHYRLNSKMVILSRDFHSDAKNLNELKKSIELEKEIIKINKFLKKISTSKHHIIEENRLQLKRLVNKIIY